MSISALIKQKIEAGLAPEHLELINESHKHAGHAGDNGSGESHFKLIVVSKKFTGYDRMTRHRMVFSLIDELFGQGLHALSLRTLTPAEHAPQGNITQ